MNVIGFLIFDQKTDRAGNIGGGIIRKVLLRAGFEVEDCQPQDINKYRLVLVSLPSTYQVVDLLKCAYKHNFAKRETKILVGGFGCQNLAILGDMIDFAYYGRAHCDIVGVVGDILRHGGTDNPHVLDIAAPRMTRVNHNAPLFSDYAITESFTGCRNMCKFCHYAHVRAVQGETGGTYVQGLLTGGKSPEVLLKDITSMTTKPGRVRTAIDGFSERLRMAYGKKIKNTDIVRAVNHLGSLKDSQVAYQYNLMGRVDVLIKKETVVVVAYNIGHMPGETEEDECELHETLRQCSPKERVIVIIHTTPFRPSLMTPMQWMPVKLFPQWSDKRELTVIDKKNLLAKYSFTLEGAYSHLESVVVDRFGIYGEDEAVLSAILRGPRGNAQDSAMALMDVGGDKYTWRLEMLKHDPLPFVSPPCGKDKLRAMARVLP